MLYSETLKFVSIWNTVEGLPVGNNEPILLIMRISAIDLGSNAARMMVAEWQGEHFEVLKKYRVPLRLGADVFHTGTIAESTLKKAEECFKEFASVNSKMQVIKCKAVATSATREAQNREILIEKVRTTSGINLEIIDGQAEAQFIFEAVKHHVDLRRKQVLLIDVGGGSIEITHSDQGHIKSTQSFQLGTVRLLEHLKNRKMSETHIKIVLGDQMKPVIEYFDKSLSGVAFDFAVGTGGNLECMAKLKTQLLMDLACESVFTHELGSILDQLMTVPPKSRVQHLGMREDRADVIVPATAAVEAILRQGGIDKIVIPGVGLRDGLLYSMI